MPKINKIYQGNCLDIMRTWSNEFIDCVVTSPPYWNLRDYGIDPTEWPEISYSPMCGLSEITIPEMTCCFGLEETIEAYIGHAVLIFREVFRILKKEGTLWLNIGDSYAQSGKGGKNKNYWKKHTQFGKLANINTLGKPSNAKKLGLKPKDICGIPWRLAFALQADGWILRQDIIWAKTNYMPESVKDRCTKSHEYVFLFSKSKEYYFNQKNIYELAKYDGRKQETMRKSSKYVNKKLAPHLSVNTFHNRTHARWNKNEYGERIRNKSSVWKISIKGFKEAHFATFPEKLIVPCILAGCPMQYFYCNRCEESIYLNYGTKANIQKLQKLWKTISSNRQMGKRKDVLCKKMQSKMDCQTQKINERMDCNHERLQDDSMRKSSKCIKRRICNGTSTCNGRSNGTIPNKTRSSSSYKSYKNRQQDRKFRNNDERESRQNEKTADPSNYLSPLWEENKNIGTCPKCGNSLICKKGICLDIFMGAGTTALVAKKLMRNYLGTELNTEYVKMAENRIIDEMSLFAGVNNE